MANIIYQYSVLSALMQGIAEDGITGREAGLTTHTAVRGTLFGFYSPSFTSGFSAAGFHLHFLSDDRRTGGHALSFDGEGALKAAVASQYQLEFPQSESFHQQPIRSFVEREIPPAEGGIRSALKLDQSAKRTAC